MHRLTIAVVAALVAALAVVSLSAAAHQSTHAKRHHLHRIVSLSPTVTEDLFAIGAGKEVVAVDNQSSYPKRAPQTSLSGYDPNVEAIANYHPDLVVIGNRRSVPRRRPRAAAVLDDDRLRRRSRRRRGT